MMRFYLIFLVMLSFPVFAQQAGLEQFSKFADPMQREGKLLSLHISRGNPVRFFLAGKEEARFDSKSPRLQVRLLEPFREKVLRFDRFDNYFEVSVFAETSKFQTGPTKE